MNVAFFTKLFSRCAKSSSSFAKTFLYVREPCKSTDKGNNVAMYRKKNNICISWVFNGLKYIFPLFLFLTRKFLQLLNTQTFNLKDIH